MFAISNKLLKTLRNIVIGSCSWFSIWSFNVELASESKAGLSKLIRIKINGFKIGRNNELTSGGLDDVIDREPVPDFGQGHAGLFIDFENSLKRKQKKLFEIVILPN